MNTIEKMLEKKHRIGVEKRGGLSLKFESPGKAGVPDRIVFPVRGRVHLVEFKTPPNDLSPLQKYWFREFTKRGYICYKIDSEQKLKRYFDEAY